MINYERYQLKNGLTILIHNDTATPMAAVNVLYKVGSRDENPQKTGLAHLLEHLMFSGSLNAPNFDHIIQSAGGENNAFTNNDITNYYDIVPANNLETALFLEADRMNNLILKEDKFEVQKKVVIEEFKETCLEKPYGMIWHNLSQMAFKQNHYQWPTIGFNIKQIEDITLQDVKDFYKNFYSPNNAILSIAGNLDIEKTKALVQQYFDNIPSSPVQRTNNPIEPAQNRMRSRTQTGKVPLHSIHLAFHMPDRLSKEYMALDLLSDILASGDSARMVKSLSKESEIFSYIDVYITGTQGPGLFLVEGKLEEGTDLVAAEKAIWEVLETIKKEEVTTKELIICQNKFESALVFSEMSVLNKTINLGYFESIGKPEMINNEAELYKSITPADIKKVARKLITKKNCSRLIIKKKNK